MNKITFTPGESYRGNLSGQPVTVLRSPDAKLWEVYRGSSDAEADFVCEVSDRAELEQRFGKFTEVEVI